MLGVGDQTELRLEGQFLRQNYLGDASEALLRLTVPVLLLYLVDPTNVVNLSDASEVSPRYFEARVVPSGLNYV